MSSRVNKNRYSPTSPVRKSLTGYQSSAIPVDASVNIPTQSISTKIVPKISTPIAKAQVQPKLSAKATSFVPQTRPQEESVPKKIVVKRKETPSQKIEAPKAIQRTGNLNLVSTPLRTDTEFYNSRHHGAAKIPEFGTNSNLKDSAPFETKWDRNEPEGIESRLKVDPSLSGLRDNKNSEKWRENLIDFLLQLLPNIVAENQIEAFLSDDIFEIWENAFTDETFDINDNYEELEKLGDQVLKLVFTVYLMDKYPGIKKNVISAMHDQYMSKSFQKELAIRMKLAPLIRVSLTKINTKILENVFEAFFGAVFQSAERVAEEQAFGGYGYTVAKVLIADIFKDIDIDLGLVIGRPATQIKELLNKLGFQFQDQKLDRLLTRSEISEDGTFRSEVFFPREYLQEITQYNIHLPRILGVGIGNTETVAKNQAYANALKVLTEHGLTQDYAQSIKDQRDLEHPAIKPFYEDAIKRANKEGFIKLYLLTPGSGMSSKEKVIQLIGERKDGTKELLRETTDSRAIQAKSRLLSEYASGL